MLALEDVFISKFALLGELGLVRYDYPGGRECGSASSLQPHLRATCKLIPVEEGEGDTT